MIIFKETLFNQLFCPNQHFASNQEKKIVSNQELFCFNQDWNLEIWGAQQHGFLSKHSLSQYLWYWSSQTIWNIIMQLIATRSSKPSSLEEGYAGGLNPHQKRMQPPALQQTSPLPLLWDRTSCRWGPLMPAHHLSTTQGRGFLQTYTTLTQHYLRIFWRQNIPDLYRPMECIQNTWSNHRSAYFW